MSHGVSVSSELCEQLELLASLPCSKWRMSRSCPQRRPQWRGTCSPCRSQPKAATSQPSHLHRLQSQNGGQQVPLSTATVSMVHSVPELMVSSEVSGAHRAQGRWRAVVMLSLK